MSKITRRTFLKEMAYGSLLTAGGLSSLAIAKSETMAGVSLPSCDIQLMPKQHIGSEILSVYNHTQKTVTIDGIIPKNLDGVNQYLTVKINKLGKHSGQSTVTLAPGEKLKFVVSAISSDNQGNTIYNSPVDIPNVLAGQLLVSSNHSDFNGVIPVTVFDSQSV